MADKKNKNKKIWMIVALIVLIIGFMNKGDIITSTQSVGGATSSILALGAIPIVGQIIVAIVAVMGGIFAFKYGQFIIIILILYLSVRLIGLFKKS